MWQPLSVRVLRICALRKPYFRCLDLYGLKHDFSALYMINKTKQMFFWQSIWGTSCKGTALFWKRGRAAAVHLHLKRHALKLSVFASTQNRHFQNDIINDLWVILSWNFTDTFWGHLRLILHLVKMLSYNAINYPVYRKKKCMLKSVILVTFKILLQYSLISCIHFYFRFSFYFTLH